MKTRKITSPFSGKQTNIKNTELKLIGVRIKIAETICVHA